MWSIYVLNFWTDIMLTVSVIRGALMNTTSFTWTIYIQRFFTWDLRIDSIRWKSLIWVDFDHTSLSIGSIMQFIFFYIDLMGFLFYYKYIFIILIYVSHSFWESTLIQSVAHLFYNLLIVVEWGRCCALGLLLRRTWKLSFHRVNNFLITFQMLFAKFRHHVLRGGVPVILISHKHLNQFLLWLTVCWKLIIKWSCCFEDSAGRKSWLTWLIVFNLCSV